MKNNIYGRSMVEMLGVLAIIGVLSVGAIAGYSKAMIKYKINKSIDQISHMVANIKTIYSQQNNYEGVTPMSLIQRGGVPDGLITSFSKPYITNIFGGEIEIENYDKNKVGDHKAFIIYFHGIPSNACIKLATKNWGTSLNEGLIYVAIRRYRNNGFTEDVHVGCNGEINEREAVACAGGKNISVPMPIDIATNICKSENTILQLKFF